MHISVFIPVNMIMTWLLDKAAEATGVKDDLLKVLDGSYRSVLEFAMSL